MSSDLSPGDDETGLERIEDPDNYNYRRRLKQLHDARERVIDIKNRALNIQQMERAFSAEKRDRYITERVVDYVHELRPLLEKQGTEDVFLSEEIGSVDGESITMDRFAERRGRISTGEGTRAIPYEASMEAWHICNSYFERVAGPEFEDGSLPSDSGFDTTGSRP